jgi:hypothetical protein
MRLSTLTSKRFALLLGAALAVAAAASISLTHGAARADEPAETQFVSYKASTGVELSAAAIANVAVRYAREFGEAGQVTVELARGTLTQAKALMEGGSLATARAQEDALSSSSPSSTFCFGGQNASCTAAEQQHAKEVLYEEGQASTYLVAVMGKSFAPVERLPRGAKPVVGGTAVMLIDAHTGIRIGLAIGAGTTVPELSELEGAARFVAAPQSSFAQMASGTHDRPRPAPRGATHSYPPNVGSVAGTFSRSGEVVVFSHRSVFARAKVRRGHFDIARVFKGSYHAAGRTPSGKYCRGKDIVVRPRQETVVHLSC